MKERVTKRQKLDRLLWEYFGTGKKCVSPGLSSVKKVDRYYALMMKTKRFKTRQRRKLRKEN
jgi:hypothetical protein